MPKQSNSMMVSDKEERAYAEARRELDSGNVREGLWAKVCAEETEDERRKAQYLRYRAQQIWYTKNTAETEARRKSTAASIKHWATFIGKRVGITFLLFLLLSFLFAISLMTDDIETQPSLVWECIMIFIACIFSAFPVYLVISIVREAKQRKASSKPDDGKAALP